MRTKTTFLLATILLTAPSLSLALNRTELLPENSQSRIHINNVSNVLHQVKISPLGQLWSDEQVQNFLGNITAEDCMELLNEGELKEIDELYLEEAKMLKGEVAVAIETETEEPYLVTEMSQEDFEMSLEIDQKINELSESPIEIKYDTFQDVQLIEHIEPALDEEGEPTSSWQAHLGNTLISGPSKNWIEQSIVRIQNDPITEPKGTPTISVNIPVNQLISMFLEKDDADETAKTMLDALGLLSIQRFNMSLELHDDHMVSTSNLHVSDLTKGLFTLLDLSPTTLPDEAFIPTELITFEAGRFNLLGLWKEVGNILDLVAPEVKPQYDMIPMMAMQMLNIDIEQALLANLGPRYFSYTVGTGDDIHSVVAVDLKDSTSFQTALETAITSPMLQQQLASILETETFLDTTLYSFVIPDDSGNEEKGAFCMLDQQLLYGELAGVQQAIRTLNNAEPLADNKLLNQLRDKIPENAFGYSIVNWKYYIHELIGYLKKPEIQQAITQQMAINGTPIPPLDFDKLPSASHLAQFFNINYQYIESTADGLHHKVIVEY